MNEIKWMTPEEIRNTDIGLSYDEHLEMAYENVTIAYYRLQAENARLRKEWISVKDRLPEKYKEVLVLAHNGKTQCVMLHNGDGFSRSVSCRRCNGMGLSGITHWMPLPTPLFLVE